MIPRCEVEGPLDPVPFEHLGIKGAVPRKCSTCRFLFEGECTRVMGQIAGYLSLDHGPCPIRGKTLPVLYETEYIRSKVFVPEKCASCHDLKYDPVSGFVCNYEREVWGAFPRELDWGNWSPEYPNLGLESGRSVSVPVMKAVAAGREVDAIKAFRADHKDATFKEAREAFRELSEKWRQFLQ